MLAVYCCALAEIDDVLLREYENLLSADERERVSTFRIDAARRAYVVSRALLRSTLAQRLNCAPRDLHFTRDRNNKPQLEDGRWQFNLSHSGDWVALALSTIGPVGIDVEGHARHSRLEGISKRFFSAREHTALMALPEPGRQQRFFELWTLKEAYVKALGRGIATAMAGTDIEYRAGQPLALRLKGAACCEGAVFGWHYTLAPFYSLALALIAPSGQPAPAPQLFRCQPLRHTAPEPTLLPRYRLHSA